MRYAVIADIHANLAAFTAVLDDVERWGGVAEVWCLGDVVGYGPDLGECLGLMRQRGHVCIAGDHDCAVAGKLNLSAFDPDAAAACRWTTEQLSPEDIAYLGNLPQVMERGDFTLVHGSPREPVWEYLLSVSSAKENFACFKLAYCLVGHSHLPSVFRQTESGGAFFSPFLDYVGLSLGKSRMIINPGSVGQPRDSDPRASYAILDSETRVARLYRVSYDIEQTQFRMKQQNLSVRLISRLSQGL
jgi:diadenosine tetraphosphatase ApaH/serine/threonine PP2A family protein phosphatase